MNFIIASLVTIFSAMAPSNYYDHWRILPTEVVEWQIGDTMEYNLSVSFISGKVVRSVVSEVEIGGDKAIWLTSETAILGQKQKIEQLIRRSDATLLKLIVNGEEKPLPDPGKVEIVEEGYKTVTVPAGTFEAIWVKINTEDAKGVEAWINPRDTCMDGMLKMVSPTQMGKATMELTKFKKVPSGKIVHLN